MRYLLIIFFITGCSTWSKETKLAYMAMMTAQSIDYVQTYEILNNDQFEEANVFVGNESELVQYIIVTNVIILILAKFLSDDWRKYLFATKTGINISNVIHNYEIGVRLCHE